MTQIEYFVEQNLIFSGLNSPKDFIAKHNLASHLRNTDLVLLRYELMYRLRKNCPLITWDKIGKMFDKNHSTVIAACKEIENLWQVQDNPYLDMLKKYSKELDQINFNA